MQVHIIPIWVLLLVRAYYYGVADTRQTGYWLFGSGSALGFLAGWWIP
jgi:hypothetical protein